VCIYPNKFGTKQHQNHQSPLKGVFILPCEMQHTYMCHNQRWLCHISLNVIIIVWNIYMKHNPKCEMYGPTMQCHSETYYQMSATVPNLFPQPKSSLINHLINVHLPDAWPTVIQMSPQLIHISHRILIDPSYSTDEIL